MIWRVRLIKSAHEAEMKRVALGIVDAAFDVTIANARIGDSEIDLVRRMQAQVLLNGAERSDPIAMLFGTSDFAYSRWPTERQLVPGAYIWTDFRAIYGGQAADRNRTARAGEPIKIEFDTYAALRQLCLDLCSTIRPGLTCSDVYAQFETLWHHAALGPLYSLAPAMAAAWM